MQTLGNSLLRHSACLIGVTLVLAAWVPSPGVAQSVEDFVTRPYIHGVPYEQARQFGADAVPALERMLQDRTKQEYWTNVVYTIAYVAEGAEGTRILTSFLEDGTGVMPRKAEEAKRHSLIALGFLIARTGNASALQYLVESVRPSAWRARDLEWESAAVARDELYVRLVSAAIQGLGSTGLDTVETIVRRRPWSAEMSSAAAAELDEVGATALQIQGRLQRQGLRQYLGGTDE